MKRTVEIILGVIGIITYGLITALGGFMLFLQNSEEFLQEINNQDPGMGLSDFETMIDVLGAGGWLFIITSILAAILGVIAIFLVKGNKKPKTAGAIFIIVCFLGAFVTVGLGIIPGIFYLFAGIMCFVRKPIQQL